MKKTYWIKPWRGMATGRLYYDIYQDRLIFRTKMGTYYTEQEAEEMLAKLRNWNEPPLTE